MEMLPVSLGEAMGDAAASQRISGTWENCSGAQKWKSSEAPGAMGTQPARRDHMVTRTSSRGQHTAQCGQAAPPLTQALGPQAPLGLE